MRKIVWSAIAALASTLSASAFALPDRIGDFALLDTDGAFHQLSRMRDKEALVLMSFDNSCASIESAVAQLQALQASWADQDVVFALINSSAESDVAAIRSTCIKTRRSLTFR